MVLTSWRCCLALPSSQTSPSSFRSTSPIAKKTSPHRHPHECITSVPGCTYHLPIDVSSADSCFVNDILRWDPGNFLRLPLKCKEFIISDLCLSPTLPKPLLRLYSHTHNSTSYQSHKSTNLPRLFLCQVLCIFSLKRWAWSVPSLPSEQFVL